MANCRQIAHVFQLRLGNSHVYLIPETLFTLLGIQLPTLFFPLPRVIQESGKIVKTGDISIAKALEKEGYKAISDR